MAANNYFGSIEGKNIVTSPPYPSKGKSFGGNLISAFPGSPIHSGQLTVQERIDVFQKLVLDGEPLNLNADGSYSTPKVINGYFQDGVSRDYTSAGAPSAPDINSIDITDRSLLGEVLPSPYMPNPSSPGAGSLDAGQKPAFDGTIKDASTVNAQFGTGNNSLYNPAVSSKKLSDLKLGNYLPGKSGGS
jgi:hypothetical protein